MLPPRHFSPLLPIRYAEMAAARRRFADARMLRLRGARRYFYAAARLHALDERASCSAMICRERIRERQFLFFIDMLLAMPPYGARRRADAASSFSCACLLLLRRVARCASAR